MKRGKLLTEFLNSFWTRFGDRRHVHGNDATPDFFSNDSVTRLTCVPKPWPGNGARRLFRRNNSVTHLVCVPKPWAGNTSPKIQKIASCEEREALSFIIFPIVIQAENVNEKHARSLPKLMKNLLKIGPKSIQNGVPEGSWSIWGPFRETRRLQDRFLIDFGLHFGTSLGPCWGPKS